MSLTLIFLLIAVGLILLLVEIFVVPGTSVVGIAGGLIMAFSIWQAYYLFGNTWGHTILGITMVSSGLVLYGAFKSNTWKRVMLSTNISGRVNEIEEGKLHTGDFGKSVSRISPMGTAIFAGELYEVHTNGEFIDQETELIITRLEDNKVFVKRK